MLKSQEIDALGDTASCPSLTSVLIVEDDGLLAMMMEDLMSDAGASQIHTCRDAPSALKLIGTEQLDCAVLDVSMHGGSTYEVADALAARNVPFLFCTGMAASDIDERHRARPVLPKPYSDADFNAVLAQALGR